MIKKKSKIDKNAVVKALLLTALIILVLKFFLGGDFYYLTQVVELNYGFIEMISVMFIFIYGFFSMTKYVARTIILYDDKLVSELQDIKKGYKAAGKRLDKQYESECEKLILKHKIKNLKKDLKKHD
jgi:ABC-type antimicrobial peptide transport system ATPase subunit